MKTLGVVVDFNTSDVKQTVLNGIAGYVKDANSKYAIPGQKGSFNFKLNIDLHENKVRGIVLTGEIKGCKTVTYLNTHNYMYEEIDFTDDVLRNLLKQDMRPQAYAMIIDIIVCLHSQVMQEDYHQVKEQYSKYNWNAMDFFAKQNKMKIAEEMAKKKAKQQYSFPGIGKTFAGLNGLEDLLNAMIGDEPCDCEFCQEMRD